MALKHIAVKGCELDFKNPATGLINITGEESEKVFCDGKAAYKTIQFSVTNYVGGDIVSNGTGGGTIDASSETCEIEGMAATLEGDESAQITFQGQDGQGNPAIDVNVVYVKKAGQKKCSAR